MSIRDLSRKLRKQRRAGSVEWSYVPTARQEEFHRSPLKYKLFGGAMGGGKSFALCAEAIKQSLKWPGNRGYLCRHNYSDFKRSTLVTFDRVCPPEFLKGHYRDDKVIVFRNGSEIQYGGLGGEEDLEKIKSTEFGWFGIDEASETFEQMFTMLVSRLRWKLPDGREPVYHGFITSNPEPGWVKDRFVDQRRDDHAFVPSLPRDNPHLRAGYDDDLRKAFSEEWVKRYLDGSWDVFEGQIYKEFSRERHVYGEQELGQYWDRLRVIDHGYTNPTCCLWIAVDHDGRMWVYDEHYERELTIVEHAAIIKAKEPDFKGLTLCDPSMFNATMQKSGRPWSPADEYRENGIILVKPYDEDGWKSEGTGIILVKQRLGAGMLRIQADCKNTIREILRYKWRHLKVSDRGSKNLPEIPVDVDNHACDALRYASCWRPMGAAAPKPKPIPGSLHWEILKLKKQLGGEGYAGWN